MKKLILSLLVFGGLSANVLAQTIMVNNLNGTGDWLATYTRKPLRRRLA